MLDKNKENNPEKDWDIIWSRDGFYAAIINFGRERYNYFFRKFLLRYITKDTEMVELGSGTATLALSMADKMKSYTGLDYSEEAIRIGQNNARKHKTGNTRFLKCDVLREDARLDGKFDIVWSQGLVEHFDDYEAIVGAHGRMAKKGGVVLISVPYRYSYHTLWYFVTRPRFFRKFWPFADQSFLTRKELLREGRKLSSDTRVMFLPPAPLGFILGIIILRVRKN